LAVGDENFTTSPWLQDPGQSDITTHVDFTAVQITAEQEGLQTIGVLDQTYFLLALVSAEQAAHSGEYGIDALKRRLALKTLVFPGGIGSTHKVLIFGKGVGTPLLQGCSFSTRTT
jgi:SAM-dependent MidA family methyltransferase